LELELKVCLVCLVYLVESDHLDELNKTDQMNQTNQIYQTDQFQRRFFMKRFQGYILGLVVVLALTGCSSYRHHGMGSVGSGDAYWQKGQQDMAALIDRTVKDPGKAGQVKSIVGEIVTELKASREQERAGHRRLYELSAKYEATPEEFTKVLDDTNNLRMQSATKVLLLRFRMKDLMTAEEWKALSDQMLAYSSRYKHSEAAPTAGY
jgi:hypothetical protein